VADAHLATPLGKPRALGIPLGGRAGPHNAITDVPEVTVGYATLIEGTDVRTGSGPSVAPRDSLSARVTALHPRLDPGDPCAAGFHSLNGNGEMTGTASRVVADHTVGVLVQPNFGSRHELTIAGVRPGEQLAAADDRVHGIPPSDGGPGAGSIVAIVATDAPLLPHQCAALARRVTLGIARTGTTGSRFSGDLFLVLSTGNPGAFAAGAAGTLRFLPWRALDPYFEAVVQATEEAVLNALVANEDMTGYRGHRVPALPRERVRAAMP
jgi:L-aminopeptidase/D-esterase-like protein